MKPYSELQAGIFILLALLLLGLSIMILGQEREIFAKQHQFHTAFSDIQGLAKGAGVRLGGISIGRVADFTFSNQSPTQKIDVLLLINDSYIDRIREDSTVTLQTQGLLGDKFLNILPGTSAIRLKPGSTIKGQDASDVSQIFSKASTVVDNSAQITASLNAFLENFDKETINSISSSLKTLSAVTQEIKNGQGLLHRLIYSKKDGDEIVSDIKQATSSISDLLDKLKNGDGLLHRLVYEKADAGTISELSKAGSSLGKAADELTSILKQVKEGNGLAHDIIYTENNSSLDDTLRNLADTVNNLKAASESLAQGSGTIGALLIDSKLYDNLVEVTDGAKRSFILRQAVKYALESGKQN